MPRTLTPLPQPTLTDWNGTILPPLTTHHLYPTCIVRLVIQNPTTQCAEAIYFSITKIKDGTYWGVARDTYRLSDWVGMKDGQQMTFRREHINEIPIEWQPRAFRKAVRGLVALGEGRGRGYAMTGLRG